jgi:hypothetical protein
MRRDQVDGLFAGWDRGAEPAHPTVNSPDWHGVRFAVEVTYTDRRLGCEGDYFIVARFDADRRLVEKRWGEWCK